MLPQNPDLLIPIPPIPSLVFDEFSPAPDLRISVVVPVRNEATHLVQVLDALRQQQNEQGSPLSPTRYEVLLLTNNCTDNSRELARYYQQQFPSFRLLLADICLPAPHANIGTVRRLLMNEAYRRLMSTGHTDGIIASTDGDTLVDRQWINQIIREIDRGNDAVGGRILTQTNDSPVRLNYLRDVTYRTLVAQVEAILDPLAHDPWPRHFQHFGANLAVTCTMYEKAGRLPLVPHLEDEAFYRALLRLDAKIRKSPLVRVVTSMRMQGRATVGFSEQLRYWDTLNREGNCQLAEPAEAVLIRLRNRHRLRRCWQADPAIDPTILLRTVATELTLPLEWLWSTMRQSVYFGQLWEQVEARLANGRWAATWPFTPITATIQDLRAFLNDQYASHQSMSAETYPSNQSQGF
ncbi:glycosyltransferase [Spirosoma sp. KUDC1026]|uniref:glycosyltransferase n=1 Tax=Spirosoma sp. KUDC1026 TaxID=2745947 RepID=UPI00159BA9B2|nr:glycosyltransferase [Spirosoma sp. KUDC1026]QKZ13971.1 glycosyltransferase [Spirosoma sp. KUDC1026]